MQSMANAKKSGTFCLTGSLSDVFDLRKDILESKTAQDLKRYKSVVGLFALAAARQAIHDFHECQKSMVS
jgi:hypothetical protein